MDGHFDAIPSTSAATPTTTNGSESTNQQLANLARFEPEFVKVIAEQFGMDLQMALGQMVSQQISSFIRKVLKLARKFQKSARRKWLCAEDLEVAMAYYGYSTMIGYEPLDNSSFRHVFKHGRDLFIREEQEMDLVSLMNSSPPKLPLETTLKGHWLVINGTQPAIPENPLPPTPKELALQAGIEDQASTSIGSGGLFLSQLAKSMRKTEQVQIKQVTTHSLSMEQQVFFMKIMEAIMGQDEQKRIEALNCLQTDYGLRAMLPRFSIAITEGVRCNIVVHNMAILVYLMRMIQALSQNPVLSLEHQLHELLPAIISCILSRQLSSNQQTSDTHCVLREFSADLLAQLLRRYRLPHIHTRIIRALSLAFNDPNCALPTLYGAAYALCELGAEVIQRVFLPNVSMICAIIQRVHTDKLYSHERSLGERFYSKILEKLNAFVKDPNCDLPLHGYQDFINNFGGFGEDIYKAYKSSGAVAGHQHSQQHQPQLNSSVYNSSYDTTSRRRSERWLHPVQKQQLQPPPAKVSRDNG